MRYLYRRGRGSSKRVMHLTPFDPITGRPTMLPLCGKGAGYDTTVNLPLGRPLCKWCAKACDRMAAR